MAGKVIVSSKFDPSADIVLYPGNCIDLLKNIPSGFFQLVITSPPYNLGKPYEKRVDLENYLAQQKLVIEECCRTLADSGSICWQVGNFVDKGRIIPLDILLYPIFASLGLQLRNRIIWEFGHGLHASRRFSGRYEVILWFTKTNNYIFNLDPLRIPQKYPQKKHFKGPKRGQLSGNPLGKNPSDIWEIPNVKANHVEKTIHPCQFPVELVERLVLSMTNEGDWVFDPFMGVGTTALAAIIHKRKSAGAEILPEYVRVAKERIRDAENGSLRIRPAERPVYEPGSPNKSMPPRLVHLDFSPTKLSPDANNEDMQRGAKPR
ncbi:MAG: site-specific DNA-methyltransferase [Candidatus Aminicenantales bacterium]